MKTSAQSFWSCTNQIIQIKSATAKIEPEDKILLIGSCFSQNIVKRLSDRFIDATASPFGVLYNPLSISNGLKVLKDNLTLDKNDFILSEGIYRNILFDRTLAEKELKKSVNNHQNGINSSVDKLKQGVTLILSFGSSNYWYYKKKDIVAGNCHKLPQEDFVRKSATVQEMSESLIPLLKEMKKEGSIKQIITTISPVRYKNENGAEASLSKSKLRLLCDNISNELKADYFPSYEIMLDELRDYRWYSEDLIHPNTTAIDYIFDRFIETFGSKRMTEWLNDSKKLFNGLQHKSLQPDSCEDKLFKKELKDEKKRLYLKWKMSSLSNIEI